MTFLDGRYAPPKWLLVIRIAQVVVSTAVVGLTAYAFATFTLGDTIASSAVSDAAPGLPFSFFTFAWTIAYLIFAIFFAGLLQATAKPNLIVIVFECLTIIFWLVTFALLADESAQSVFGYSLGYDDFYGVYVSKTVTVPAICVEAAAGLGALVFLLFVASLVTASIFAHRAQKNAKTTGSENVGEFAAAKEAQQSVHSFVHSEHGSTPPQRESTYTSYGSNPFSPDDVHAPQQYQPPQQVSGVQQVPIAQLNSPVSPQTYRSNPIIYAA